MVLSHNPKPTGDWLTIIKCQEWALSIKWIVRANFLNVCTQVREILKSNAVPIVLPIGDEDNFKGCVDLVKNRAIIWHEENMGATFDVVDIPEDMKDEVEKFRGELIEAVAEYDENLLENILKTLKAFLKMRFTMHFVLRHRI